MRHLVVYLLLLFTHHVSGKKKNQQKVLQNTEGNIGAYPMGFFESTVPKFVNNHPVIGVLSIGLDSPPLSQVPNTAGKAYIGSSYVKWLESAGARVAPIIEDISDDNLEKLLDRLNGVVLPGGDLDSGDGGYYDKLSFILKYSKQQWKQRGVKFPILGIGRGATRMIISITGKDSIADADANNLTLPVIWTNEVQNSRIYGKAPPGLLKAMEKHPMAFYLSSKVVPSDNFFNNTKLNKTLRGLATNTDRNGTKFISAFEGKKLPWYGLQWQPEAPQYEFNPHLAVDHSISSIIASQYLANFFVSETRQNANRFGNRAEENDAIIAKDYPIFVGNVTDSPFDQIYLFKMSKHHTEEKETEDDEKQEDGLNF